jgi:hypothetical protein
MKLVSPRSDEVPCKKCNSKGARREYVLGESNFALVCEKCGAEIQRLYLNIGFYEPGFIIPTRCNLDDGKVWGIYSDIECDDENCEKLIYICENFCEAWIPKNYCKSLETMIEL